eukprot:11523564-Heterocapsa_arctica.AAC.1
MCGVSLRSQSWPSFTAGQVLLGSSRRCSRDAKGFAAMGFAAAQGSMRQLVLLQVCRCSAHRGLLRAHRCPCTRCHDSCGSPPRRLSDAISLEETPVAAQITSWRVLAFGCTRAMLLLAQFIA